MRHSSKSAADKTTTTTWWLLIGDLYVVGVIVLFIVRLCRPDLQSSGLTNISPISPIPDCIGPPTEPIIPIRQESLCDRFIRNSRLSDRQRWPWYQQGYVMGYTNPNNCTVIIPRGDDNLIVGEILNGSQPTHFLPGTHTALDLIFSCSSLRKDGFNSRISWTLRTLIATSSNMTTHVRPHLKTVTATFDQVHCPILY